MRTLKLIQGWWRHIWGFCPKCNCDAPECDTCDICYNYANKVRGQIGSYPFPKVERAIWWERFKALMCLTVCASLTSCQLATHESHASATKGEKDMNVTWGGTTHTTGADGWDNATDHNASFQVFAQAGFATLGAYIAYLQQHSADLLAALQNTNLTKSQIAGLKFQYLTTQAQLQEATKQQAIAAGLAPKS